MRWLALAVGLALTGLVERVPAAGSGGRGTLVGAHLVSGTSVIGTAYQDGGVGQDPPAIATQPAPEGEGSNGCLACHVGIEDMHPWQELSCVDCHGGTPAPRTSSARVRAGLDDDERVLPMDRDLTWLRFRNPSDLRVVDVTRGTCHADLCSDLFLSLHGTTAGHLSDGFYEMGLTKEKGSLYGVSRSLVTSRTRARSIASSSRRPSRPRTTSVSWPRTSRTSSARSACSATCGPRVARSAAAWLRRGLLGRRLCRVPRALCRERPLRPADRTRPDRAGAPASPCHDGGARDRDLRPPLRDASSACTSGD